MDVCERLGANVKRLRKAAGVSQEAFADMAEINRTYLSDIERGARNPTITVVDKIARSLGVPIGSLFE